MDVEQEERWLPVLGFEGLYSISSSGRLRSEPRVVMRRNGVLQTIPGKLKAAVVGKHGYLRYGLNKHGANRPRFAHRLVLDAFVGPAPAGCVCCHNDGNPGNANLNNLRWDTMKANSQDAIRHGSIARGERIGIAKLTADQVLEIRADKRPNTEISRHYGIDKGHVSHIKARHVWAHI